MNFKDLVRSLPDMKSRGSVTIEFVPGVEDLECYPETGMRATLVSITEDGDKDLVKLHVNYEDFDEFNTAFESRNYFDREGKPVLTAREAGYYHEDETIYVMGSDKVDKWLRIIDDGATALYAAFRLEAPGISYTRWLENKIMNNVMGR